MLPGLVVQWNGDADDLAEGDECHREDPLVDCLVKAAHIDCALAVVREVGSVGHRASQDRGVQDSRLTKPNGFVDELGG